MDYKADLIAKFQAREARIAIIGLGYVGLPLAVAFAQAGFRVIGIDVDEGRVERLNQGHSHIADVSESELAAVIDSGNLRATSRFSTLQSCDAVSICVPTPLNKTGDPDVSYIVAAVEEASQHVHSGMLFVLESTTYPGTTSEVVLPILAEAGLEIGESGFLAFSPERIDPGRKGWNTRTTPRVIGGITQSCLEVAMACYGEVILDLVPVSSTEAAEMVKLLENTFRAINIGLANEAMLMCDALGLDAWEVVDAAATKPFGFMKFVPGPGIGGHCIPVDPLYLSWRLKRNNYRARFIELATEINTSMPAYWVERVQDQLNEAEKPVKGSHVLVLGVTYKKDVDDLRESPALDIIRLLEMKGADVSYHDPHVLSLQSEGIDLRCVPDLDHAVSESDCVIVVTDHSVYDWNAIARVAHTVVDTRRAVLPAADARFSAPPTSIKNQVDRPQSA